MFLDELRRTVNDDGSLMEYLQVTTVGRTRIVPSGGTIHETVERQVRWPQILHSRQRCRQRCRNTDAHRRQCALLYRVVDKETFLNGIHETNGTIMDAQGDSTWSFTVRYRDHAALTRFHQFYQAHDFPVHIGSMHPMKRPRLSTALVSPLNSVNL